MSIASHNPDQYMLGFRQLITNGKKKIGILVGAGAPVSINVGTDKWEPLIPNLAGLTQIVRKKLNDEDQEILREIEASIENNNLEKTLSKIRAIAEIIGTSELLGKNGTYFNNLSASICSIIRDVVNKDLPSHRNPYQDLVSWINGINRKYSVEIFTTNYDLLLEQALERSRTPYFDGFSGAREAFFDPSSISRNDMPARWVRLWKLHGSVGWELSANGEVIRIPRSDNANMVYPSHIKYDQTQAAPFSSLFERLRNFLAEPDTLLISTGFSFADAHISSKIIESLLANPSSALFAFQFGTLEHEANARSIAMKCPNFSAYCRDGAVINGVEGTWQLGGVPTRNWSDIRQEYYKDAAFILGDFDRFARFLAASGGNALRESNEPKEEDQKDA